MKIRLYFDGCCDNRAAERGFEPLMGYGVHVVINGHRAEEYEASKAGGVGTSNIAEWLALTEAFKIVTSLKNKYPDAEFNIYGDSQLICHQFNGIYEVKKPHLKAYAQKVFDMHKALGDTKVTVEWIRREMNVTADVLSKIGVDKNKKTDKPQVQEPKKVVAKIVMGADGKYHYDEAPF